MRLLLVFVMLLPALARAQVPLADFVRDDQLRDVQISPDGTYLSDACHLKGEDFLTVRRLSDRKITNVLKLGSRHRVASYWWMGKDRIVAAFSQQSGAGKRRQDQGRGNRGQGCCPGGLSTSRRKALRAFRPHGPISPA